VGEHPSSQRDIWRVDPTGQFWNCHAAVVGRGAGTAESLLLKKIKHFLQLPNDSFLSPSDACDFLHTLSVDDALLLMYQCIQETLSTKHHDQAQSALLQGLQALLIYNRGQNTKPRIEFLCGQDLLNKVNKNSSF